MYTLNSVAVLMRAWNNNTATKTRVKQWLAMGIGTLVVVVNDTENPGRIAEQLSTIKDSRLHIHTITENYSASRALNTGVEYIRKNTEQQFILCASVEALFTEQHVVRMLGAVDRVAVVGTTFSGIKEADEPIELPPSYTRHPLNTGALYNLSVIDEPFAFDVWCDDRPDAFGMEDLDIILRKQLTYEYRDLNVPVVIGRFYNQDEKEQRRERAVSAIVARARQQWPSPWLDKTLQRMNLHES